MYAFKQAIVAGLFSLFLCGGAQASSVINLTGPDVTSGVGTPTGTFDNGLFDGTVAAVPTFCIFCTSVLEQDPSQGLGVDLTNVNGTGNPVLDAILGNLIFSETLVFSFSQSVTFESIEFGMIDPGDDWTIAVDGVTIAEEQSGTSFDFAPGTTGTTLTVTTIFDPTVDGLLDPPDDISVKSITVVPLPAPALLLLAGLAGLGLARARRA